MDERIKEVVKGQFAKMRVLVVDDMYPNTQTYTYLLTEMGFDQANIYNAVSGMQGLSQMAQCDPGLVITDWNMPKMDGLQMVKRIRLLEHFQELPIIMITAEEDKDVKHALPYVNAVLKKPYTLQDVEREVYLAVAQDMAKKIRQRKEQAQKS